MDAPRTVLRIRLNDEEFIADFEAEALRTVALLKELIPTSMRVLHARWSGEALWTPLPWTAQSFAENCTCHPQSGQILLYPGGISEPELLMPYGACRFASKAGSLPGNHIATVRGRRDALAAVGQSVLRNGPVKLTLDLANS